MENKSYQLRYLPIFETDLLSTVNYITNVLKNEDAAHRLVDDIESAILKRLENPLAFEPYRSAKRREYPYYRIYVRNYVVYYVVIGNVMEVEGFASASKSSSEKLNNKQLYDLLDKKRPTLIAECRPSKHIDYILVCIIFCYRPPASGNTHYTDTFSE